jgi:hypothetical protein
MRGIGRNRRTGRVGSEPRASLPGGKHAGRPRPEEQPAIRVEGKHRADGPVRSGSSLNLVMKAPATSSL